MMKTKVLVKNTEELFYAGERSTDRRSLYSYPATVQERPADFTSEYLVPVPLALTPSRPDFS
jgi:hypothetical protein